MIPAPEETEITPETVAGLAAVIRSGGWRVIDCREEEEWRFNRLPDAALVPLSRFAELAPPLVDDPSPLIIYCHHGMRSLRATEWLRSRGKRNVWSMSGGIEAWSDRVDPSVPKY